MIVSFFFIKKCDVTDNITQINRKEYPKRSLKAKRVK